MPEREIKRPALLTLNICIVLSNVGVWCVSQHPIGTCTTVQVKLKKNRSDTVQECKVDVFIEGDERSKYRGRYRLDELGAPG